MADNNPTESEINVDLEKLISKHQNWTNKEAAAASDAGTRRQEFGAVIDEMGLEGKALSQFRAGLKIKNSGKQMDWLRSMEVLLPIARNHIMGNSTDEMSFDAPPENEPETAVDEVPVE